MYDITTLSNRGEVANVFLVGGTALDVNLSVLRRFLSEAPKFNIGIALVEFNGSSIEMSLSKFL